MNTSTFYPFRSAHARDEYLALYMERAIAWPVASETKFIETPSGQTFVRLSGRPADPPLVLLPGSRANSLMWIPNIAALSAHYRTYALDSFPHRLHKLVLLAPAATVLPVSFSFLLRAGLLLLPWTGFLKKFLFYFSSGSMKKFILPKKPSGA